MVSVRSVKKNNKRWFMAFIGLNSLLALLMIVVNPYRVLPFSVNILGINDIKPALYDNQRYVKIFDIARIRPKTILLGSSRVLWGIDPANPVLQQKGYMPVYNAGILGPPMYEIRKYFDHALVVQPHLKRVILGLDFYAFNAKFDNRQFSTEIDFGKNSLGLLKVNESMLFDTKAIYSTVVSSAFRRRSKSLRDDGRLTPAPLEAPEIYQDFFHPEIKYNSMHNADTKGRNNKISTENKPLPSMRNELYDPFRLSEDDIDAFKYIVAECKKRDIELYVFMTPTLNSSEFDVIRELNLWHEYEEFQRKIASVTPFWDFISWNEVTLTRSNYVDGSHYIFPVGKKIIDKMLGEPDPGTPVSFGRYITADNVNQHLITLDKEWHAYIKNIKKL